MSIKSGSRRDAKLPDVTKSRDIYGGKLFGRYQLYCYVLSVIVLLSYFVHFLFTGSAGLSERVMYDSYAELVILVIRMCVSYYLLCYNRQGTYWLPHVSFFFRTNELYFDKLDVPTLFHHIVHFLGMYLGITTYLCPTCASSLWLLCHMQILHIPMFLWYYGCRINCVSKSVSVCNRCRFSFPYAYMLSCGYRMSIMMGTTFKEYQASNYISFVSIGIFSCIMAYLDYEWMHYFLGDSKGCLNWPLTTSTMIILHVSAVLVGLAVCFLL